MPDEAIGVVECASLQRQVLGVGGDAAPGVVERAGAQAQLCRAGVFKRASCVVDLPHADVQLPGADVALGVVQGLQGCVVGRDAQLA